MSELEILYKVILQHQTANFNFVFELFKLYDYSVKYPFFHLTDYSVTHHI